MSDSHEEYNGGHELEAMDAIILFKIVFGLGAIVLAAVFVVIQFFYQQTAFMALEENGAQAGFHLQSYYDDMDEGKKGLGAVAKEVGQSGDLKAAKAPAGWVNPDDVKEASE
jgi:hypothetical protein